MHKSSKHLFREFDCKTCVKDVQGYIDLMANEETARQLTEVISGPAFCADPHLGLTDHQVQECVNQVKAFVPAALKSLFVNYQPSAELTCMTYFNVCTSMNQHTWFAITLGDPTCQDKWRTDHCQRRKDEGKCNKRIVKKNCQKTCGFCGEDPNEPEDEY